MIDFIIIINIILLSLNGYINDKNIKLGNKILIIILFFFISN